MKKKRFSVEQIVGVLKRDAYDDEERREDQVCRREAVHGEWFRER